MASLLGVALLVLLHAGPDDFRLTIPVSPETAEGQRLLAERARQICAGRYPMLARYRFSGREQVGADGRRSGLYDVSQELSCADRPPPVSMETPAPADWRATESDEAGARAATERYFAAVDAGDAARVHAMWTASQQAATPLAERAAELRSFRAQAGRPGRHRIVRLTWYVNPDGADRPGIYVAADYERSYSGFYLNCGYLVWFRQAPGRYELIREETGVVGAGDAPNSPEGIAQARSLARCQPQ
ncbi:MAG TPA: hypothetical protein VGO55_00765 [Allosphingosinicella sp.]|jgi:hypothetical protein|nr:hypothetical protein [Allosphingosinicella sp.]